jgi:hypothetical protein
MESSSHPGPGSPGGKGRMPAVNGVGEPCAGEPHARFDAAGAGNGAPGHGHCSEAARRGNPGKSGCGTSRRTTPPRQPPTLQRNRLRQPGFIYQTGIGRLSWQHGCHWLASSSAVAQCCPASARPAWARASFACKGNGRGWRSRGCAGQLVDLGVEQGRCALASCQQGDVLAGEGLHGLS